MRAEAIADDTPQYEHDCPACTFLGRMGLVDLYHCAQRGMPTVIARHSSNGPDYVSGMPLADHVPELGEARERARARGLFAAVSSDRPQAPRFASAFSASILARR